MKYIIYLLLTISTINSIVLEDLIDKHISAFERSIGNDFSNKLFGDTFYYTKDELTKSTYFGFDLTLISIKKDQTDTISSITVHFQNVIDNRFYNSFIEKYGKPDSIQIIENKKIIGESTLNEGDFRQHLRQSTFDLREGTFEEKPLYIIWKKDGFQIRAFLRHKQNISEITFSRIEK